MRAMFDNGKSKEQIDEAFRGVSVVTDYGNKKQNFKIDRIDFTLSPKNTFKLTEKNGEEREISFNDYFKERHGVTIDD